MNENEKAQGAGVMNGFGIPEYENKFEEFYYDIALRTVRKMIDRALMQNVETYAIIDLTGNRAVVISCHLKSHIIEKCFDK